MKKRGQITIFVVLGIVILTISGILYYTHSSLTKEDADVSMKKTSGSEFDAEPVKKFAESCLRKVSDKGLWTVGEHGGYINPDGDEDYGEDGVPDPSTQVTSYGGKDVPYYLIKSSEEETSAYFLTLKDIEEKLSRYIIVEFEKCLDSDVFESLGFEVKKPDIDYKAVGFDFSSIPVECNVSINIDSVTVQVEYPMTVRTDDGQTELREFRASLPVRLGRVHNSTISKTYLKGILVQIKEEWDDGDGYPYYMSAFGCDTRDPIAKKINIYSRSNDNGDEDTKIINVIDYNTYYHNYQRAYRFNIAVKGPTEIEDARIEEDICSPVHLAGS
ncbi:hypothetical protein KY366_01120 [Candidatus Woesearchaeota archaeon]|nr:hypothetical protein [Candidatus Woesearchaeota archaeon]